MSNNYLWKKPIPIGVFWDMENCSVPFRYSALEFVTNIRDQFYDGHFEADFVGVCDIHTQRKSVLIELSYAQVTTIHVCNTCKNAADDKLRLLIRKFASIYSSPATIILVTSDINFSPELSDLRYKHNYRTILIHGRSISTSLLSIPNETFYFDGFFTTLEALTSFNKADSENILFIRNLPFTNNSTNKLKGILERLFSTTQGKVLSLSENIAIIKFPNFEAAFRAKARYSNQRIGGKKIDISIPNGVLLHRVISTNYAALRGPKVAVSAKIACDLLSGSNSASTDLISSPKQDCLNICDTLELLHDNNQNNSDSSNKGWKPMDRRYAENNSMSLQQHPHANDNKFVVTQVFKYGDCNVKTGNDNLDDHTDGSIPEAVTASHLDKSGHHHHQQAMAMEGHVVNHGFSPINHRDLDFFSSKNVSVNRKLFPNARDASMFSWNRLGTPQRYLSPDNYCEADMGFRRTPGARRPNSQPQIAGHQIIHQDMRPRLLFSSNAWPSRVENANNFGRRVIRHDGIFSEKHLHPQQPSKVWHGDDKQKVSSGIDLVISNLDYNISSHEWKKILRAEFQNVQMRSLNVEMQTNNTSIAIMNVASMEDAKYVISQFHRKKIGYKRIHVAVATPGGLGLGGLLPQNDTLKPTIIETLSSLPGHKFPLIQFFELFEKRFQKRLTILDLQGLDDSIEIVEQENLGKLVVLRSEDSNQMRVIQCQHFCANRVIVALWEGIDMTRNPKVKILLKGFSSHVHKLLQCHEGSLPLQCFPVCYAKEFSSLKLVLDEEGVSLEHLVTCVPGVEVVTHPLGGKHIQWSENNPSPTIGASVDGSPILSEQTKQLNREVVELLKNTHKCCIELSKFFTLYQQYFGRQCRCSDFGCNNLIELLRNLSQNIQVVGYGGTSCMIFTHKVQVSRFTSEILKILKVQGQELLDVTDLPQHYGNVIGKPLDITEFGVCFVEDMISELLPSTILVTKTGGSTFLSIPQQELSADKSMAIKMCKDKLVTMLRMTPDYCIPYNQFLSSYYKCFKTHFNLSDCGFSQISDIFDSVSDSIKIAQLFADKYLCLTEDEMVRLTKEQIIQLFNCSDTKSMEVSELSDLYLKTFGHPWKFKDCGVSGFTELVNKLGPEIMMESSNACQVVLLKDSEMTEETLTNVLIIVMDFSDGRMPFDCMQQVYHDHFREVVTESFVAIHMKDLLMLQRSSRTKENLQLILFPEQMFARDVRLLFLSQDIDQIPLSHFEQIYQEFFKRPLKPELYNQHSLASLFKAACKVISFDGYISNWNISIHPKFKTRLSKTTIKSNEINSNLEESLDLQLKITAPEQSETYKTLESNMILSDGSQGQISSQLSIPGSINNKSSHDFLETVRGIKPACAKPISDLMAFAAKLLPTGTYKSSHLEKRIGTNQNKFKQLENNQAFSKSLNSLPLNDECTPFIMNIDHPLNYHHKGLSDPVRSLCSLKDASGGNREECYSASSIRHGPYGESYDEASSKLEVGKDASPDEVCDQVEEISPFSDNPNATPISEKSLAKHRPLGSSHRRPRIVAKFNLAA